jgi:hypothetical protein
VSSQYYHCRVCGSAEAALPEAQSNYADCEACGGRAELRSLEAPPYSPAISEEDTDFWGEVWEEEEDKR